jgi:hypothetical protein
VLSVSLVLLVSCSSGDSGGTPLDVAQDTTGDQDIKTDIPSNETPAGDIPQEDVDWNTLPLLPPDKTFATRYAAGAGSRIITPAENGVTMGGYGLCIGKPTSCKYSRGVHDDLKVQAAAIADTETGEVVILLGLDCLGLLQPDIKLIHEAATTAFARELGVRLEGNRLVVAFSHSHGAPDTVGIFSTMLEAERDEEAYIAFVRERTVEAALEAFGNLQDAVLDRASGSAPNHGDDLHAKDDEVFVLRARTPEGDPIFHVVRWAAHPTVFRYENLALSADFVGSMRKRIEDKEGGTVVYLNGPIGSIYPDDVEDCTETDAFPDGYRDELNSDDEIAQVTCVGYRVADEALKALDTDATPVAETGVQYRFRVFEFHANNLALAAILNAGPFPVEVPDINDPEAMMPGQFAWITIGDLNWLTTPGESFPHFAQNAKDLMIAAGLTNTLILGVAQDYYGYLMSVEQYPEKQLQYFRTLSPGDLVEPPFLASIAAMLEEELGDR